jgi:hypothetical protein
MLEIKIPRFYKVKSSQTLAQIARTFCVSEYALVKVNGLKQPPAEGELIEIPQERGNLYTVREGDTKTLLCGSDENYEKKNGAALYLGMRAVL